MGAGHYGNNYPTAVRCFEEDFEACIAHLHCPPTHRRAIRTTNLLERLFGEERRRMRAAGSLFGERPVLKLMYSAVIRASDSWRGVKVTEFEHAQLQRLQKELTEELRKKTSPWCRTAWPQINRAIRKQTE
jgi:putative transposase